MQEPNEMTAEEREMLTSLDEIYAQWKRQVEEESRREGASVRASVRAVAKGSGARCSACSAFGSACGPARWWTGSRCL